MSRRPWGALLRELEQAARTVTDECIRLDQQRRPKVRFRGRIMNASRAVWIIANGDPGDLLVLHGECNDGWCINLRHLYLGTPGDNMRDRSDRGTHRPVHLAGERNGRAKLTEADVAAIRESTDTRAVLAARYALHPSTISKIRLRRSWREPVQIV